MHNWSTDIKKLQKNTDKHTVWKLEQLINFGLNKEKISRVKLIKYWDKIEIDPARRKFLSMILWPKKAVLVGDSDEEL